MLREARETGGKKKKDSSFHAFGLSDKLFSPKYEHVKHERNFKSLLKVMDDDISEQEQKMSNLQK
jgi:hypothetical protein